MRRAASALPYATDEDAIVDGLVQVPVDALELAARGALPSLGRGSRFEGVATARQTKVAPPGFGANDLLVRMLLADEGIVWLDELRSHLDLGKRGDLYPGGSRNACVTSSSVLRSTARMPTARNSILKRSSCSKNSREKPLGAYDHVEAERARERYSQLVAKEAAHTA